MYIYIYVYIYIPSGRLVRRQCKCVCGVFFGKFRGGSGGGLRGAKPSFRLHFCYASQVEMLHYKYFFRVEMLRCKYFFRVEMLRYSNLRSVVFGRSRGVYINLDIYVYVYLNMSIHIYIYTHAYIAIFGNMSHCDSLSLHVSITHDEFWTRFVVSVLLLPLGFAWYSTTFSLSVHA